jgi:multiple sugar transport system substrate-binding protein
MRKFNRFLALGLSLTMTAACFTGCGKSKDDTTAATTAAADTAATTAAADTDTETAATTVAAADEGKVLNIYCWNEEFKSRVTDHYPNYVDNGDNTGSIGDVKVVWTITPTDDNGYQNKLDEVLPNNQTAAADDKVDLFLAEADYALKYVNSDYTVDVTSLGLTADDMANQYQYTKDIVTDSNGVQKGVSWQACPGLYLYRRSVAKTVFGTDDPTEVQNYFKDWATFEDSASKISAAGYKILSGYDDAYRVFSNNVSAPWVDADGKIQIDANIMAWVDQTKAFTDAGYNEKSSLWSAEWSKGASSSGDVFGYFGPAWFIDFCLAGYTLDNADKTAAVGNGTWGDWGAVEGPQPYFWGGTWICGATGTDNPSLVKDIMYQLTCNPDVMKEIVTADNDFCNNAPLMEDMASAGTTSAFLGGENVLEKFVAGVGSINMSNISGYDQGLNESFQAAMKDYFDGTVDEDTALANFYSDATTKYPELTY